MPLIASIWYEWYLLNESSRSRKIGPQQLRRHHHQQRIERRGGQEDQREPRAVDRHQGDGRDELRDGGDTGDAVLHEEVAHLPDAFETPLQIAGAARREVRHRQREQPPRQEVERRRIDPDRREAEQISLQQRATRR